jgi:hypothetical protein
VILIPSPEELIGSSRRPFQGQLDKPTPPFGRQAIFFRKRKEKFLLRLFWLF